jgi:hypothetical protein
MTEILRPSLRAKDKSLQTLEIRGAFDTQYPGTIELGMNVVDPDAIGLWSR